MLTLNRPITLNADTISSANLCEKFDLDDLKRIGEECWAGYNRDELSRAVWMRRNEAGMDLALQIQRDKTFPWPGCSNVAFPLVTIAAMQFHARSYPATVSGSDLVKCEVVGEDESGELTARANRISTHMSWQLLKQDAPWEEQEDKAQLNLSIVGTNFKKSYWSSAVRHPVSELVLAKDLVLNYWAKSVEACPRKTHLLPMFRNEIHEKVMRGTFRDVLEEPWYKGTPAQARTQAQTQQDNRQGVTPPQPDDTTSFQLGEQHVNLDLDDDGYAEPYIITFELNSKYVLRIVTRFDSEDDIERVALGKNKGKIIQIKAVEYFSKKTFIPSPDGGIYDIGFGVFLGPLNESVNTLVNQLIDAGTMQTTSGGFLARGAKIRGGVYTTGPFEWKRVDSSGDDLRKSIFPLPVNAPSEVLFQLLSLLINYTNRIAGTTDMMVGENPGQNTPAETSRTMVEMGQKIYTAIFKRVWRGLRDEFQKIYQLNRVHLDAGTIVPGGATRDDYQRKGGVDDICPAADPNITSDVMQVQQATMLKQSAATTPGYNRDEAERRFLKAIKVDAIAAVFPGSEGQAPPKDPKIVVQEMKNEVEKMRLQMEQARTTVELMEEQRLNNAKIIELGAMATKLAADAQSEQAYAQVALINAQVGVMKTRNEHIVAQIEHLLKAAEIESTHVVEMKKASQKPAKAA